MNGVRQSLIVFFLILLGWCKASAQVDPGLEALILLYTENAEKELKAQERSMLLETTGHIWLKEEWEETAKIQQKYNDYLDRFRSIVTYAAEIYGFYHEISMMTDAMGGLVRQLEEHPANALAVAISAKRNAIYRELILTSVDIVNDIRLVCLSDIKMSEKERVEIVFAIRPKLKKMNKIKDERLVKKIAIFYAVFKDRRNKIAKIGIIQIASLYVFSELGSHFPYKFYTLNYTF